MNIPDPNQPDLKDSKPEMPKFRIPNLKIIIKKFKRGTVLRAFLIAVLAGLALGLGGIYGSFYAIKDDLPDVADIETFRPKLITTVYAADGRPVKEFAEERRVEVSYAEIPKILIEAIVATEDPNFFRHGGVDLRGILRAGWADVFKVLGGRRPEGGSTGDNLEGRHTFSACCALGMQVFLAVSGKDGALPVRSSAAHSDWSGARSQVPHLLDG